jgi:hypothetical protein
MKPIGTIALAASVPLTYAIVGKAAFERDVAHVRAQGLEHHGPLSLPQHVGVLGAQALAMGLLFGAAFGRMSVPSRIALGAGAYAALGGAAALAGVAESRNRLYG